MGKKFRNLLYVITIISFIGIVISQYYTYYGDPVANFMVRDLFPVLSGFEPCLLCWYSRVLLYPLFVMGIVGLWRDDVNVFYYIAPFTIMGIFLETYHYAIQMIEALHVTCGGFISCATVYVSYFGFITIPLMALISFIVMAVAALIPIFALRAERRSE